LKDVQKIQQKIPDWPRISSIYIKE